MPWPTYSEQFVASQSGGGYHAFLVPYGKRAVVKMIAVTNGGAAAGFVYCTVGVATAYIADFPAARTTVMLPTFLVAYNQQTIAVYAQGAELSIATHGFLFDDPSHATGPPAAAGQLPGPPPNPENPYLPREEPA